MISTGAKLLVRPSEFAGNPTSGYLVANVEGFGEGNNKLGL
jgi:hypothetical protein